MTAEISDDIIITVNGEEVNFKAAIIKEKLYLPVRVIDYALSSEVDTKNIQKGRVAYQEYSDFLSINSGKRTASHVDDMSLYLNGEYYKNICNQIIIIEDRSYLPVKSVSKNLGIKSTWSEETRTIEVVNPLTVKVNKVDKTDKIDKIDQPYYVKELPEIKKQQDHLIGNWKGHDSFTSKKVSYKVDSVLYITENTNGLYTMVARRTFNDSNNPKYNGISYIFEYNDCKFDSIDNSLSRNRAKAKLLLNEYHRKINAAGSRLYLSGEVLFASYGNNDINARYQRF